MAGLAYEGVFKVWRLDTEPAGWQDDTNPVVTEAELTAGTRLLNLISDGGFAATPNTNTASQAKVDLGKISHNIGTREYSGLTIIHEADFPLEDDPMWNLYAYGDKCWFVVAPGGFAAGSEVPPADAALHVFEAETDDPVPPLQMAQDTIQNFQVTGAIQDWNVKATFSATA